MDSFTQIQRKSLRSEIHDSLRNAIVKGVFKPGERIVESQIARSMGVSQAPVREALRELEQAGLVVSYPSRGAYVRKLTMKDIQEIYSLRAVLERFAVQLRIEEYEDEDFAKLESFVDGMVEGARNEDTEAFVEQDFEFHSYICRKAGHALLYKTWLSFSPLNWTFYTASRHFRPKVELAERHYPLVESLRSRDPEIAGKAIWAHIAELADEMAELHKDDADEASADT